MKKIILIVLLLLIIGLGVFYFFGNGKSKITDFFSGDTDFGSFFDIEPQSKNDFINTPDQTIPDEVPMDTNYSAPILRQISFEPISGYTFYATTSTSTRTVLQPNGAELIEEFKATSTVIRFQERATGHIYDVFEFAAAPRKISNITVQKVYNTLFSNNRDTFLHQTPVANNEQIKTTYNKIIYSTSTPPALAQNDISTVVNDFAFNKAANKLVYSIKQGGVSNIYTANFDKTGEKLVTTLSFNDFLLEIINTNNVLITTKASQTAPGYAYVLNTTTGALNKILGNINGLLVKVSPDEKYYVYSQSEQSRPAVRIYNTTTKTTNLLNINTLPEKCVFSQKNPDDLYCFGALVYKAAQYPDDWYKGKIFNADSFYKISLSTNYVQQIYNFDEVGLAFDVINPQLTTSDGFIIFQNKYDLTLWSINLNKVANEVF